MATLEEQISACEFAAERLMTFKDLDQPPQPVEISLRAAAATLRSLAQQESPCEHDWIVSTRGQFLDCGKCGQRIQRDQAAALSSKLLAAMEYGQESPAGSAGLVAEIDAAIERWYDGGMLKSSGATDLLQRARDRIVELESSGDVAEIRTLLALKSQFAAQQERIVELEAELAAAQEKQRYIFEQLSQIVPDDDANRPLEKVARLAVERYAAARADARRSRDALKVARELIDDYSEEYGHGAFPRVRDICDAALASPSGQHKENK